MWQQEIKRASVHSLAYSPDSTTVYTGDARGRVSAWERSTGSHQELFRLKGNNLNFIRILIAARSRRLLLALAYRTPFRVWDLDAGQLWPESPTPEYPGVFALAPDDRTVAYCDFDSVHFWDLQARGPSTARPQMSCEDKPSELVYSSRGMLGIVDGFGDVYVVDPDDNSPRRLNTDDFDQRVNHDETALPVFSPDGSILAACVDQSIVMWDVATGEVHQRLKAGSAMVHRLAFHPRGRLLLSAGNTKKINLWDTTTGQEVNRFDWGIGSEIDCLAFSPDGMTAAAGANSGKFIVWDVDED
jgi:WD40 repeat protein